MSSPSVRLVHAGRSARREGASRAARSSSGTHPAWSARRTAAHPALAVVRTLWRAQRRSLLAWALALAALSWYSVDALSSTYATPQLRVAGAVLATTPGVAAFTGPGLGLQEAAQAARDGTGGADPATFAPDLGALVTDTLLLYLLVPVALHALLAVTRHTRTAEDSGLAEVIRAGSIGRLALPATALGVEVSCQAIMALAVTAGLLAGGLPADGAILTGSAVAACGLSFAGMTLLAAQLLPSGRSVRAAVALALLVSFELRAGGDVAAVSGSHLAWVSRLSPLGWAQATGPWATQSWAWLVPLAALTALTAGAGLALARGRDLGATAVSWPTPPLAARPGPRGLLALTVRTHAGTIAAWCAAGVVIAGLYGSIAGSVESTLARMLGSSPYLAAFLGGELTVATFLTVVVQYLGYLAGACATALTLTAWHEERSGRAEVIAATAMPRGRRLAVAACVGALVSVGVLALAGFIRGGTAALTTADAGLTVNCLAACLAAWPACLIMTGLACLATGLGRAAGALSWSVFTAAALIAMLAQPLNLPDAVVHLSAFTHTPDVLSSQPPLTAPTGGNHWWWLALTIEAVLGLGASWIGCRLVARRDLRL